MPNEIISLFFTLYKYKLGIGKLNSLELASLK